MKIILNGKVALDAMEYSNDAKDELLTNMNILDKIVNTHFEGLQDPTFKKYLELSVQMQNMLRQVWERMDDISNYCKTVYDWTLKFKEN